jgi:tetratricopeptide (TPR) repeat protein
VAAGGTFFAVGGGSRLETSWNAFRAPTVNLSQGRENSIDRLGVEGSNGRWQLWQGAVNEGNSKPINGTGAGTYELWWSEHATERLAVRNAHSQYLEVYAELGYVGLLLMIGFVAAVLVGCAFALRSAGKELGSAAAGTASVLAFLVSTAFDWGGQVTLIPFVGMLAFAATVAEDRPEEQGREAPAALRGAIGTLAVLMLALAIPPVVSTGVLTQSQRDVQQGRVVAALGQANAAVDWQPYSAAAWLQRGLVYDSLGQSAKARASVKGAIEREPNGWRNWFALAGVEARAGNVKASLAAYRKARDLNPTSPLFAAGN